MLWLFTFPLKNADDAGASELFVIYDQRTHPAEKLIGDTMKKLQGESILIYNNKEFSEKDIDAIQQIGVGGKRENVQQAGKFGLGFNVAYHFTDVPSFVTGKSTYFMDPEMRYFWNLFKLLIFWQVCSRYND